MVRKVEFASTRNLLNLILPTSIFSDMVDKLIEGSLEVKLPTIWTDGKAEVGRVREEKSN